MEVQTVKPPDLIKAGDGVRVRKPHRVSTSLGTYLQEPGAIGVVIKGEEKGMKGRLLFSVLIQLRHIEDPAAKPIERTVKVNRRDLDLSIVQRVLELEDNG